MHGRCWTVNRRWRHGLQESNTSIICDQAVETMDHIILGYVFSREVWASCLRRFRLQDRVLVQESDIMQWWTDSRRCLTKSIRRGLIPCSSLLVGRCGRKEIQESSSTRNRHQCSFSRKSKRRRVYGQWREQNTSLNYIARLM